MITGMDWNCNDVDENNVCVGYEMVAMNGFKCTAGVTASCKGSQWVISKKPKCKQIPTCPIIGPQEIIGGLWSCDNGNSVGSYCVLNSNPNFPNHVCTGMDIAKCDGKGNWK